MDKIIMDILLASFNFASLIILIRFLKHLFVEKQISKSLWSIQFVIILIVAILGNIIFDVLGLSLLFGVIIYLSVALLFYEGRVNIKLITIMFFVIFSFISELIVALLLTSIFGSIVQNVRDNTMYMFLGGLTSKIIIMVLVEGVICFRNKRGYKVSVGSWMMIVSIPFVSIIISVISVYEPIITNSYSIFSSIVCILILYINIISFYLFDSIMIQVDANNQFKLRENMMSLQHEQYKTVIAGYEEVKKIRHDMIGHLITMDGYISKEENKIALEYIHKLSDELNFVKRGVISDNIVVDAIVNNRKALIKKSGIEFENDIIIPTNLCVEDMDLSILLGNLINNAIEACLRIKENKKNKVISLIMKYKNESLLVVIKNSYDPSTIRKKSEKYISSKKNREESEFGMGIYNIEEITRKYNGVFQTELDEELFIAKVIIPNKKY